MNVIDKFTTQIQRNRKIMQSTFELLTCRVNEAKGDAPAGSSQKYLDDICTWIDDKEAEFINMMIGKMTTTFIKFYSKEITEEEYDKFIDSLEPEFMFFNTR